MRRYGTAVIFAMTFVATFVIMFWHWQVHDTYAYCYEKENDKPWAIVSGDNPATPPNAEVLVAETIPTWTTEEHEILTRVLTGECQTGSWELQVAVGSVVLNRVAHPAYPSTIKGVVFQKGQYSCTWDGNYYRTPTARNWEVAEFLLRNGSQIPSNVVYQAQFRQGKGVWKKIGSEIFCYR